MPENLLKISLKDKAYKGILVKSIFSKFHLCLCNRVTPVKCSDRHLVECLESLWFLEVVLGAGSVQMFVQIKQIKGIHLIPSFMETRHKTRQINLFLHLFVSEACFEET